MKTPPMGGVTDEHVTIELRNGGEAKWFGMRLLIAHPWVQFPPPPPLFAQYVCQIKKVLVDGSMSLTSKSEMMLSNSYSPDTRRGPGL